MTPLVLHDLGGSGPPLLLVHANGFCGHVWAPVARRLADRWHCWAPDLAGHGDAEPIPADFSWEAYADEVLAAVDQLGGPPLAGAGHSMGGASLLRAEQLRPGTFSALYCYEPIVFPPSTASSGPNTLAAGALRRRTDFTSRAQAVANYASKPPFDRLDPEALAAYVDHGFAPTPDGITIKCRPETEAHNFTVGHRSQTWDGLPATDVPVTVAAGGDGGPPSQVASLVAERLPDANFEREQDLSHFGPLEDPERVAAAIARAMTPAV